MRRENEILIGRGRIEACVGRGLQWTALVAGSGDVAHFRDRVPASNPQLGHGVRKFPVTGMDHGTCSGETPSVVVSRCDERDF